MMLVWFPLSLIELKLLPSAVSVFSVLFLFCSCSVANPITFVGCLLERMEMDGKRRHRTSRRIMTSRKCSGRKLLARGCESRCRSRCRCSHRPNGVLRAMIDDVEAQTVLVILSRVCARAAGSASGTAHQT